MYLPAKERRPLAVAAFAALLLAAFALAASMATPAYAASTSKPYAGYKDGGQITNAASITMTSYDARGAKKGYDDFCVWTGNTRIWDNAKDTYVAAKSGLKKLKGMSYNKKTNTLTLKNVKAPKYTLYLNGMGTGFKIKLVGKKNALAGIVSYSRSIYNQKTGNYQREYPSSVTITGKGTLVLNKNKRNGSAITIYGDSSNSKLAIKKTARVQMFAYGTSDLISVTSTSAKKFKSAVNLEGVSKNSLISRSVKVPGYTTYKSESVYPLNECTTRTATIYSYNGKTYISNWSDESTYDLEQVAKVGNTNYYAEAGSYSSRYLYDIPASKVSKVGSGKYITDRSSDDAYTLNGGKFYGIRSDSAVSYFDTKTRHTYYSKWNIYQKAATISYGYSTYTYVTLVKKNVKNNKNLPSGYKGTVERKYADSYSYVVKNSSLTAAR